MTYTENELYAATEAYMNIHGMDLYDDELWNATLHVVAGMLDENIWNPWEVDE